MQLKELQKVQEVYDKEYWKHDHDEFGKIRYITLHMGKLIGKLNTYCEAKEHNANPSQDQLKNEVTPDLLFYALQLSNLLSVELEKQYLERLEKNKKNLEKY